MEESVAGRNEIVIGERTQRAKRRSVMKRTKEVVAAGLEVLREVRHQWTEAEQNLSRWKAE